jgi:NTE family protein
VGVLRKLQELRIPVDCVAGTSMGGLVAGAFSSGLSPTDMQTALKEADWRDMFSDAASYADFTPDSKACRKATSPAAKAAWNTAHCNSHQRYWVDRKSSSS